MINASNGNNDKDNKKIINIIMPNKYKNEKKIRIQINLILYQ